MLVKTDSSHIRWRNRVLVLSTLRHLGAASHTEIAQFSKLSSATVSAITAELVQEGVLEKRDQAAQGGRGRPRVKFGPNRSHAHIVTVRITGDRIEFSLVDYGGVLIDRFGTARVVEMAVAETFAGSIREGLDRLVRRSRLKRSDISAISITSKGLVSEDRSQLLWSPVLNDERIDFAAQLRPDWNARVTLTNETRFVAQAIAENRARRGKATRTNRCATLSLDHAIGLGISHMDENGEIRSTAPAFGHMIHLADGPTCRCGSRGCIEAYAGFHGILRCAFDVPENTMPAKFIPFQQIEQIAIRARSGDRKAQFAFTRAGEVIGSGVSRLFSLMGVMPLTVTGPGLALFDLMQQAFDRALAQSLQIRFNPLPAVEFAADEAELVHRGNVQTTLGELDASTIAVQPIASRQSDIKQGTWA